ncbi:MAG: glycoside hydrolase family 27 protein [Chloroflexi bacterium]|nr:MAG: glycoside hydrolase family 27 protein [Chloroflexota bacterium]
MSTSRRRVNAGLVLLGFVFAILAGVVSNWAAPETIVETRWTAAVGGQPSSLFGVPLYAGGPVGAGLTQRPPMGWNGFNRFSRAVTAATVVAEARALVASGMQALGYDYVNLDGGWNLMHRSSSGYLQPDPAKFPQGIKPVADYVHSLGLKFGIYASAGTENCANTSAGSFGHYRQDAAMFASWGVDYLKLDWCHIPYKNFAHTSRKMVSKILATQMADAISVTGRPIVYDVNDWMNTEPWSSAPGLANLWRTAPDIQDRYSSMIGNFIHNVKHYEHAGPGGWNDPDMLEVGNGGMSVTEYQSQFSLWAEMAAPLIAGNDLATMSALTKSILTNQAVIAVDQDPLGRQGYPVASTGGQWVLTKPLANGHRAVVLFNQNNKAVIISTTAAQIGLAGAQEYSVVDLWSGLTTESAGTIATTVPAHGAVFYEISEIAAPPFTS